MTLKGITLKNSISFLITLAITICVMPFNHIFADSSNATYVTVSSNECIPIFENISTHSQRMYKANVETRAICIKNTGTNNGYIFTVSLIAGDFDANNDNSCPASLNTHMNRVYTYENNNYYIGVNDLSISLTAFDSLVPIVEIANTSSSTRPTYAYRYTYGDLSVDPTPSIQVGDLKVNYYTDFASTQQYTIGALKSNRDTIKWEYDSSNSNLSLLDLKVDIRAVTNNYYSSTESGLESLGWGDIHLDTSYSADLGSYQINNNQVSYTWESVINSFKMHTNLPEWFDNVINFWSNGFYKFYNNQYYAAGWVYQIRLNTWSGDYTGEWQTIYTVPSSPPEGQQTTIEYYVNGTGMTEPVYQNIQNINNQNNITNNTWYVNGSPYGINDNSGENWFTKLLEILAGLVSDIISAITGLFGDVFSGIFDLIKSLGVDLLSVFTNLIIWFRDLIGSIDLTGQNYILPEEYTQNINTFSSWTNGVLSILFNSGFGLIVLVPFVLFIVGLFL